MTDARSQMQPRILLTRRWPRAVESYLSERFAVTYNTDDLVMTGNALRAAMQHHDALCPTVSDRIDDAVIFAPNRRVRLIANYGAGVNHLDIAAARAAGISVSNTPDVVTDATADLAILLMLMTSRRAGEGEREVRSLWGTGWRPMHMMGQSLTAKTLGLIGFGRIARATARRARDGLGMRIAYHTRANSPLVSAVEATYVDTLDALVEQSDVLSLHCPGGPETHHLINAERLKRMKPSAVLINTARGSIIDEAALAGALSRGELAGAGLDVYENEPNIHPTLLGLENVVLLPHLGSATAETRVEMGMRVAVNLERFFAGQPLLDRVV